MTFTYVLFWQLTNRFKKKKKNNIHGSAILRDIDFDIASNQWVG